MDLEYLKTKFEDGDIPSGSDFANLIDTLNLGNKIVPDHINETLNAHGGILSVSSPFFTGIPSVPTAEVGNDSNQIANTAFVNNAFDSYPVNCTGDFKFLKNAEYIYHSKEHVQKLKDIGFTRFKLKGREDSNNQILFDICDFVIPENYRKNF